LAESGGVEKTQPKFVQEHKIIYMKYGHTYPPVRDRLPDALLAACTMLTVRQFEVIAFMELQFPAWTFTTDYHFVDFNLSLHRLEKRGWSENKLHTMVGSMRVFLRHIGHKGKSVDYRVLSGIELMSVIGWHPRDYLDLQTENHQVLCRLAENAYSGFAVLPLLVCLFAVCGRVLGGEAPATPVSIAASGDDSQHSLSLIDA
jgi:hypothetical protein